MIERNIYKENDKYYVRNIKRCVCQNKQEDIYTLECRILERGEHDYMYKAGDDFIRAGSLGEKKLWLGDAAKEIVAEAVDTFEKTVSEAKESDYSRVYVPKYNFYVYYKRIEREKYNFIVEFTGENRMKGAEVSLFMAATVSELLDEVQHGIFWDYLDTGKWSDSPKSSEDDPLYLAIKGTDEILERLIRLYYREASVQDCDFLSKHVFNRWIMPPMPEEYDKDIYVNFKEGDKETFFEILSMSGYDIRHVPAMMMGMKSLTHDIWTINPHRKEGRDAAPKSVESITVWEFMEMGSVIMGW